MNAALAAWYGVPVVAVTGDDVAIAQVKENVPDAKTAMTKRAINMRAAQLEPLQKARSEIQRASREGVARIEEGYTAASGTVSSHRCSTGTSRIRKIATAFKEIELVAPDTIAFSRDTMPEAYRLIRVLYRFINPD